MNILCFCHIPNLSNCHCASWISDQYTCWRTNWICCVSRNFSKFFKYQQFGLFGCYMPIAAEQCVGALQKLMVFRFDAEKFSVFLWSVTWLSVYAGRRWFDVGAIPLWHSIPLYPLLRCNAISARQCPECMSHCNGLCYTNDDCVKYGEV